MEKLRAETKVEIAENVQKPDFLTELQLVVPLVVMKVVMLVALSAALPVALLALVKAQSWVATLGLCLVGAWEIRGACAMALILVVWKVVQLDN